MWFWISFLLLGLVAYLPVGAILWAALMSAVVVFTKNKESAFEISEVVIGGMLTVLALLFHGGLFGWYDKIEAPNGIVVSVDDEVSNDFYRYEEKEGKIYLTVTDKNFYESNESHLVDNGDIHFGVQNENARKERANLKWTIKIDGKEYERDSLPAGTETHLFGESFSLKTGENVAAVTAKNDLGEVTKTVIINKLSTEAECAKSENSGVGLCKNLVAANLADSEKKAEEEAKRQAKKEAMEQNKKSYSGSSTNDSSELDGTADTTNCDYAKYGKCWDDVLEQAYEDGTMDAYLNENGYIGNPHYQGCEGVCTDIYDDEYWKGYYYYR